MTDNIIYHVVDTQVADTALQEGTYQHQSLLDEGFIHCCLQTQIAGVLDRYYQGVKNLVVLKINSDLLDPDVVFENTAGGDELFPHVYGKINTDAVISCDPLD